MKMRQKLRRCCNAGTVCLVPGVLLAVIGTVRTIGFLRVVHTYREITARELIHRLILPHMVMLLGAGLMVTALVFFTRAAIIRGRQRDKEI